jgi:7,8-dihydropterin-6-yl-methyl-4-(beta-D-ribofuranosyl)aminobenzene 5'-phosphate synthase
VEICEEFGVTLVALEPVDRVDVTTLVDNTADMLLPDVGPVRRWGLSGTSGPLPVAPSGAAVGGSTLDFLRAEHGYSALVDVYRGGRMHRVLYDTGVSPFGLVENLDRLGISPDTFQAIVLSHGHFDHLLVTGEVPRRPPSRPGCPRVTRHGWMASGGTTRWSTKTRRWWRTSAAGDS